MGMPPKVFALRGRETRTSRGVLAYVDAGVGPCAVETSAHRRDSASPSAPQRCLSGDVPTLVRSLREFDSQRERVHENLVRLTPRHRDRRVHGRGDDVGDGADRHRHQIITFPLKRFNGAEHGTRDCTAHAASFSPPFIPAAGQRRLTGCVYPRRHHRATRSVGHRRGDGV